MLFLVKVNQSRTLTNTNPEGTAWDRLNKTPTLASSRREIFHHDPQVIKGTWAMKRSVGALRKCKAQQGGSMWALLLWRNFSEILIRTQMPAMALWGVRKAGHWTWKICDKSSDPQRSLEQATAILGTKANKEAHGTATLCGHHVGLKLLWPFMIHFNGSP